MVNNNCFAIGAKPRGKCITGKHRTNDQGRCADAELGPQGLSLSRHRRVVVVIVVVKSRMLPTCRSASANDKVGYYYSRHVDRLTCKRLERHTPPPSTVSLTVQGSSAEWAGGRASRRVSRTRRSEDCICHLGSDMEHITPVGQWSQAESKLNNG